MARPGSCRSTSVTRKPARCSAIAVATPTIPAPTTVADLPERVPMYDVFLRAANVPRHADEILALPPERRPDVVWLQSGIRHDESARRLAEAGIDVVQDRCLGVYASLYRRG